MIERAKLIDLVLTYKVMSLLLNDEAILIIGDFLMINRKTIVIRVHLINKTLFLCIQLIYIVVIFNNIRQLLKFKGDKGRNECGGGG